jgi:hypothetical protein
MRKWLLLVLLSVITSCGGGSEPSPGPQVAELPVVFDEPWDTRTFETGVMGTVLAMPLVATPDHSDPQTPWGSDTIHARWGTLAGLDGTFPDLPDVTGTGGLSWWVAGNQLHYHATPRTGYVGECGFALISQQKFDRTKPMSVQAELTMDDGEAGAFAGLALIAGEGDYREMSMRVENGKIQVKLNAPELETLLAADQARTNVFRIDYDPVTGFTYLLNGEIVGTEALDHLNANFANNPQIGLYFAASTASVDGHVGPLKVWQ